jgi:hypothetical protein
MTLTVFRSSILAAWELAAPERRGVDLYATTAASIAWRPAASQLAAKGGTAIRLCIHLHEDWEATGYYLYELNPDREQAIAPELLEAVKPIIGIDPAEHIDGHPSTGGLISPRTQARD